MGLFVPNLERLDVFEPPPGSILLLIKSRFLYTRSRNLTTCSITALYICRLDSAWKRQQHENDMLSNGVILISSVIKFIKNKEGEGKHVCVPKNNTMNMHRESVRHIFNLNSRWKWVVTFKLWPPLPPAPIVLEAG